MCVLLVFLVIFYLLNRHLFLSAIRIFQGWHRTVNLPCQLRWARKGEVFTHFLITPLCGWNSFQGSGVLLATHLHFLTSLWACFVTTSERFHSVSSDKSKHVPKCIEICNADVPPLRYGWTSNVTTAILRHTQHENCAQNGTGIIINPNVNAEDSFDALCYDDAGERILSR